MISYPTVLNPWFAIFTFKTLSMLGQMYYYTNDDDAKENSDEPWTENQKKAAIFMSLNSATRAAKSCGGEIQVLWNKDQLPEFGRELD